MDSHHGHEIRVLVKPREHEREHGGAYPYADTRQLWGQDAPSKSNSPIEPVALTVLISDDPSLSPMIEYFYWTNFSIYSIHSGHGWTSSSSLLAWDEILKASRAQPRHVWKAPSRGLSSERLWPRARHGSSRESHPSQSTLSRWPIWSKTMLMRVERVCDGPKSGRDDDGEEETKTSFQTWKSEPFDSFSLLEKYGHKWNN